MNCPPVPVCICTVGASRLTATWCQWTGNADKQPFLWCFNIFMFQIFYAFLMQFSDLNRDWSQVDAWGPSCLSTPWRTSRCWIVSIWGQTPSDAQKQMVPWIEGIETQESLEDCAACWFPFLSIAELCRHEGKVVQLELSPTQDTWMYTARILYTHCAWTVDVGAAESQNLAA